MKRRAERELQWGPKSTPAKRALKRLEERKIKLKELMAAAEQGGDSSRNLTKNRSSDGGSTLAKQ